MTKLLILFFTVAAGHLWSANPVLAQGFTSGPEEWSEGYCSYNEVASIQGLQCLIGNIFSVAIGLLGFAAFAMLIYGGIKLQLSGDNAKGVETARSTITFAIIGIVVALSGFVIINFVADFTGVKQIIRFVIPSSDWGL